MAHDERPVSAQALHRDGDEAHTDFSRLFALSDGLFAIVLTLLALDLRVPDHLPAGDLKAELLQLSPKLLGYLVTFVVVGVYWVLHHRLFEMIVRHRLGLLYLNLGFLLCVSLLPFTESLTDVDRDFELAWTLYALNLASLGMAQLTILFYANRRSLLHHHLSGAELRRVVVRALGGPIVFLSSIAVVHIDPDLAPWMPLLLIPYLRLVGRRPRGARA
ncbi:putative membrane protein [Deinobacterium chartae]|uniref:Putative membrane protein n=1 Tax=Deinobacterium chartae TaxID=521158 RepID=A0A841I4C9_9DEIO|nr:TMEM175 family protein [Deinobacterium chartae]MBB6100193.1 putative membrane protein [Deinobacterium chartae]